MLAIPAELKVITPYIRRAEELDRNKGGPPAARLVAYYCRQYAVQTGIPLAASSPASSTCLGHILEALEKEKPAMDTFTKEESECLCRDFAKQVFDKADQEDKAGHATKDTAKTFYAAANFYQILKQFTSDEENEEAQEDRRRILHSKWRATEILKAFKEGREPTPVGYGESNTLVEEDEEEENREIQPTPDEEFKATKLAGGSFGRHDDDDADTDVVVETVYDDFGKVDVTVTEPNAHVEDDTVCDPAKDRLSDDEGPPEYADAALPPSFPPPVLPLVPPPAAPSLRPPMSYPSPPPVPTVPVAPPAPAPASSTGFFGFGKKNAGKASKEQLADALELTRFAQAALEMRDTDLAAERLRQALHALGR